MVWCALAKSALPCALAQRAQSTWTRAAILFHRPAPSSLQYKAAFQLPATSSCGPPRQTSGRHASSTSSQPTTDSASKAAFLVIGNEILSGSIVDANTPWLAKLLYSRGVDLVRVEYIPDDAGEISESVLRLRQRVGSNGFVFTSGGIGPTHDDVTYEAIAGAFGLELKQHQPTVDLMREHYERRGVELNAARLRMATLPVGAEVLTTPGLWVPLVHVQGVYVLPGIPRLFTAMVEANKERFRGPQHHTLTLYTHLGEGDVADPLREVAGHHAAVLLGSYPATEDGVPYRVKIQLESRDPEALRRAAEAVEAALPTFRNLP